MKLVANSLEIAAFVRNNTDCLIPVDGASYIGVENSEGEITMGVMYDHFTGSSITATIAIRQGETVTRLFLKAIFDYPFEQLGCNLIIAYVAESNTKSVNFLKKAGFVPTAEIPGAYPEGPMHIYTMTKDQCRWLEKEHGKENERTEST